METSLGTIIQTADDDVAAGVEQARGATRAFFALLGVSVSAWAAVVPFTKTRLALDEARLGAILLAFGCGTIVATLAVAPFLRRYGSRAVLIAAGSALCLFLPLLARAPSAIALAVLLFGFGAAVGIVGVAGNAQAIAVQARSGRPLMSSFHAMFSVGGLTGAGVSSLLLHFGAPIELCAVLLSAALLTLVATQYRGLIADLPATAHSATHARRRVPPMAVVVVGLMTLALYLSEGAILDWGAVFLHEFRGHDVSTAALGYAAFSIAMAGGRLVGDRIVDRLGPVMVIRLGSSVAAAGFIIMVAAREPVLGLLGCALIGLGASNVVPTLISASARVSNFPTAAAVSTVVAMGTAGLIAGPALIGFIAHGIGLPLALGGLSILLILVAAAADVVRVRRQTT